MTPVEKAKKRKRIANLLRVATKHGGHITNTAKELGITHQAVSKTLSEPDVKQTFIEIMEKAGLSDEEDAKDLARLRKSKKIDRILIGGKLKEYIDEDNTSQLKALELTCNLKGRLSKDAQVNGTQNILIMPLIEVDGKPLIFKVGQNAEA